MEDCNVDESIHCIYELSDLSDGDRLSDKRMRFDAHSSQEVVTEYICLVSFTFSTL